MPPALTLQARPRVIDLLKRFVTEYNSALCAENQSTHFMEKQQELR